ncbi:MAG TPA: hypothetical protein VFX16_20820 [Pseudonocardiaceae bacterium]|nr:hypothetical protein [Pseudonocardiaceae bacterium]
MATDHSCTLHTRGAKFVTGTQPPTVLDAREVEHYDVLGRVERA